MLGASRTSQSALRERLDAVYAVDPKRSRLAKAGTGVLSVVDVVDRERSLRALWADTATADSVKSAVLAQLFGETTGKLGLEIVDQVITSRWSNSADMVDALEEAAASLLFMAAEIDGRLDQVEEELFRFGRSLDASAPLQMVLSDPATPVAAKVTVISELLAGRSDAITEQLLVFLAGHLHGRRMTTAVTQLSALAAIRRDRVVASVTSAVALTAEQETRLARALSKIQGRAVIVNVTVDPSVIGGIQVRVGDEVIDGTLTTRIEQARRRLTS